MPASRPEPEGIRPQAGAQSRFAVAPADVAIYGGAAGGGKTFGLLIEAIRHSGRPGFRGVVFRRTNPQIMAGGGLWDAAAAVYPRVGGKCHLASKEYSFPGGGRLAFRHLQHEADVYDWQGSELAFIGFDELTHFTRRQFFYLLSRLRSTCGVRPYLRATCNPDADSWVAEFLAWWIDPETGFPIPERAGRLRYFVQVHDSVEWADTAEGLVARHPELFTDPSARPLSVTFVPAKLDDNPALTKADPAYRVKLLALPLVEQERLLGGNWKIKHSAGKVFNRAWFALADVPGVGGTDCRFWDLAATAKTLKNDPDYTVGTLVRKAWDGRYYVLDCWSGRINSAEVEVVMKNLAAQDAARAKQEGAHYMLRWEQQPAAAGKAESERLARTFAGLDACGVPPRGDKITRCAAAAAQAKAGNVTLVRGEWNEWLLTELHGFPDRPNDDGADSFGGACVALPGFDMAALPPPPPAEGGLPAWAVNDRPKAGLAF